MKMWWLFFAHLDIFELPDKPPGKEKKAKKTSKKCKK